MMLAFSDLVLVAKKVLVGVLLVLIPLGIVAGALHVTHQVLVRAAK